MQLSNVSQGERQCQCVMSIVSTKHLQSAWQVYGQCVMSIASKKRLTSAWHVNSRQSMSIVSITYMWSA